MQCPSCGRPTDEELVLELTSSNSGDGRKVYWETSKGVQLGAVLELATKMATKTGQMCTFLFNDREWKVFPRGWYIDPTGDIVDFGEKTLDTG
jgi:hypothetical protein